MKITEFPEFQAARTLIAEHDIRIRIALYIPDHEAPGHDSNFRALGRHILDRLDALARRVEAESFGAASIRICAIDWLAEDCPGLFYGGLPTLAANGLQSGAASIV
jgi:hypothetical protein